MDTRSLRQVIAIRQYGSFAKAADALGVSQPALTKSVARLEDELKLKLFDRTAKGSALTPIGELIAGRADAVIAETRDLARDAALLAGGETGTVRIGCTTALKMQLLQPLVQRVVERHPGLRVHAEVAASARLLPLLEARELDVVITGQNPPDAYVIQSILQTPAVFVASPSHPLAKERDISIARLAEFKCGGSQSPGSSNARLLGHESENLGTYTASHYELLLPLVLSGDMALLAPSFVVQPYLEAGEMVILDVQWRYEANYYFVTTRAASFSPIVSEIREHARAIGDELRDDWRGVAGQFTEG
ncbi:MAG: LysR family transcriptional regulator [Phenylobacterium sp.]